MKREQRNNDFIQATHLFGARTKNQPDDSGTVTLAPASTSCHGEAGKNGGTRPGVPCIMSARSR